MKTPFRLLIALLVVASLPIAVSVAFAAPKIKIVTSLPDLADIAKQVGGDKVEVHALAKGYQDPHFVDAKPSAVLKLKRADLFAQVGLDLEIGWVPPLLETARNPKIYFGGSGYLDASEGISLLQIPTGDPAQLRAQGDIHIYGNPHYWLDPVNGKIIARRIYGRLAQISPTDEPYFQANLANFETRIDSALMVWQAKLAPYHGVEIVAYHNSWPYFENRFQLKIATFIEPKPGIPPSPGHLVSVIRLMQKRNIRVIVISPYFDDRPAQSIAKRTNAAVVHLAPSVGAFKAVADYFDLFEYNINKLIDAFQRQSVQPADNDK